MNRKDKLKNIEEANKKLESFFIKSKILKENDEISPQDETKPEMSDDNKRASGLFRKALMSPDGLDSLSKIDLEWLNNHVETLLNNIPE